QKMDVRRIYPAHGPVIEDGPAKIAEYLEHRMLRERQILEALADGVETIPAIVARIYVDVAPALHPAAALSVESHLKKLAREGRAAVHLQRALVEALERLERDALRHSLRQPLLGAPLAPRQLELGDVCELVRDETQPLAAASGQPPVEQRASRPGDADRERRQLVRALLAHGRVLHEPPAKCLARGVDVHARARRQRQPEVVREDV